MQQIDNLFIWMNFRGDSERNWTKLFIDNLKQKVEIVRCIERRKMV